ncbi:hypothetical protein [Formosa sp. PL04]|uniref:hypothetical protein n=1 Tax=Formosa sp. PL04 TaxID=3081755 RepID=UPI0029811561|nr:hypothetical protein [Formosa sp. PL04]MDW5287638.1 hypothetical protein [Formosa sp. PL04]
MFYNNLTSVVRSLGYLFIGMHLLSKFKLVVENRKTLIVYLIIIGFGAFMFFELIQIMSMTYKGMLHEYLYFFYATVLLALLILVGNYNFRYSSIQSTACMYFLFSFVVSDLFAALAICLKIHSFYYPTRIFYILGLAILTGYAVLPFPKEELYTD